MRKIFGGDAVRLGNDFIFNVGLFAGEDARFNNFVLFD